ncbi:MAG: threonine/serine exporter family protein [Clostridiales bacterium]|nr:threonine/serine exporter family protein [Clostridiales bacterium]
MTWIVQTAAAAFGTLGFAVMFGAPMKHYAYCGAVGAIGWLVYLILEPHTSMASATFLAAIVVILLSRWFAVRRRCPVTIFLISGIIPLVPGTGIYWAAYYTVTGQLSLATEWGFQSVKIAVAIVLGIVFVFELPQKVFSSGKPVEGLPNGQTGQRWKTAANRKTTRSHERRRKDALH